MIFAILTTLCYPLSAICGKQLASVVGSQRANLYRLLIAAVILGILTFSLDPHSFHPSTFSWLFFSGIIGFGVGDVALYFAFNSIGSRLTILLSLCTATIFGLATEYLWLRTAILPIEFFAIGVILIGLSMAILFARSTNIARHGSFIIGIAMAIVSGFGQGVGAVISRHAGELAELLGRNEISGISQAFQRVLAGVLFALVVVAAVKLYENRRSMQKPQPAPIRRPNRSRLTLWLFGAAVFGPVIGVSCFQAALNSLPSGIVLAIVSTSPIVLIPLAYIFEGDRPTRSSCLGGVIGVSGVVWICLLRG